MPKRGKLIIVILCSALTTQAVLATPFMGVTHISGVWDLMRSNIGFHISAAESSKWWPFWSDKSENGVNTPKKVALADAVLPVVELPKLSAELPPGDATNAIDVPEAPSDNQAQVTQGIVSLGNEHSESIANSQSEIGQVNMSLQDILSDAQSEPKTSNDSKKLSALREKFQQIKDHLATIVGTEKGINKRTVEPISTNLLYHGTTGEQFAIQESILFDSATDDVVLGMLTADAKLETMDILPYIALWYQHIERLVYTKERRLLDAFIEKYDESFKIHKPADKVSYSAFTKAVSAIESNRLDDLKTLLDNYHILHFATSDNNTLLHLCVLGDNYSAVKLLLMRGIDATRANAFGERPIDIARRCGLWDIVLLLQDAGVN